MRRSGDGVLPVPGWTDTHTWERFLNFDEHPHALNPAAGFLVTANNRQVEPEYPHHITTEWAEPWRAMRIREMVETGRAFTAADVAAQQMDVRDVMALRYLPHAIRAAAWIAEHGKRRRLREPTSLHQYLRSESAPRGGHGRSRRDRWVRGPYGTVRAAVFKALPRPNPALENRQVVAHSP